jgi:3-oxoacyl-[acyl-carrier-protein] synthase-3
LSQLAVGILGLGSCLPPAVRTNEYWSESFQPRTDEKRKKDFLAINDSTSGGHVAAPPEITAAMAALGDDRFFGARKRHVIDDDTEASDVEAEAGRRALRDAGVRPDEIDLVIVHSLVPDLLLPSNAPAVQAKCELTNAVAWSLDVSCASFQPHLVTATALIRQGVFKKVLLVLSQMGSRVADFGSSASTALGDGAAAVVLGELPEGHGLLGHWMRTDGKLRDGVVFAQLAPSGEPHRKWWKEKVGPTCFSSFDPESGKAGGLRSTEFCKEACDGALAAAGLTIDDVALYVGSQSLGWLVDACRRKLGLPWERAIDTFPEVGNVGAVAIPFNLERAAKDGRLKNGDVVLMYSPGAGLTRAAAVYRWYRRA